MSRLTPEKRHRLHHWLQENRSATDEARLEISRDELRDLDADTLLHLAAMAFITMDRFMQMAQEEPERQAATVAVCKSLGDQLEAKNTAEMRPHAKRGEQVKQAASNGGNERWAKNQREREEYQREVDRLHSEFPHLKYADLKRRAGNHFGVSDKTIHRYTTNPHKKVGTVPATVQ